jgi:predicted HAD superfamily Cof-like phosphohydrolase
MDTRNDVREFMMGCEQTKDDAAQARLYMKLIIEEYTELCNAFEVQDMVEIADACADLKWVIEGLEHSLKIPQQAVWDEVNRSNRSKFVEGRLIKHPDTGKVLKPATYSPPNIKTILRKHNVDA